MYVTAQDFEEDRRVRGTVLYDWMLSFTDITLEERYYLHCE